MSIDLNDIEDTIQLHTQHMKTATKYDQQDQAVSYEVAVSILEVLQQMAIEINGIKSDVIRIERRIKDEI